MATEAQGQAGGRSEGRLSGLQERRSWQPHALSRLEALLSGIMGHTGPFLSNVVLLQAWYEQFARRMTPWPGWSPLSLAFPGEGDLLEGQRRAIPAAFHVPDRQGVNTAGGIQPPHFSGSALLSQQLNPLQPPRLESALPRTAIKLTVLRVVQMTRGNFRNRVAAHGELTRPEQTQAGWMPVPGLPAVQPALSPSVSLAPRQELHGGFPVKEPPQTMPPGVEQRREAAHRISPDTDQSRAVRVISPPAQREADHMTPSFYTAKQTADGLGTAGQGALEKLLESTVLPLPLPGLELRMVSPEKHVPAPRRPADGAEGGQTTKGGLAPPAPASPSSAAPQLDINAVADRVYQTIIRRHQLEKERRGVY